ncbi:hypothetical protein, partial [Parabacteroides sp.]
ISASDYKISASNYIITTTDYKITDTDYRIGRHLRKNYSGQKRVFLSMEIKNCYCWIWCGCRNKYRVSRKTYRFFAIFATFSRIFRFFLKLYHYG